MSNGSESNLVKEARDLLSKSTPGPWALALTDKGNACIGARVTQWPVSQSRKYASRALTVRDIAFRDVVVTKIEGGTVSLEEGMGNAELIARAPELLSALCNEVDRLQGERDGLDAAVTVQAESIETFQSQFRVMKEAIEAAMNWFVSLGYDDELVAQLRSAITPKGTN